MNVMTRIDGKVESALVCDVPGSLASTRKERVTLDFQGIPSDRHYGFTFPSNSRYPEYPGKTEIRNSRQISILSQEELDLIAEKLELPEILPEWLGANFILSGIPALTLLPPSSRLFFERGPVLLVHGENDPCTHPGKVIQSHFPDHPNLAAAFVKAALHHRGVVAWVEHPGSICPGDKVQAEVVEQILYSQFLAA